MKKYTLEGDQHGAEMVECEYGEYVKFDDACELRLENMDLYELVKLLTIQELSDNGSYFYPTSISSCRCMDLERIGQITEKYRPTKHYEETDTE